MPLANATSSYALKPADIGSRIQATVTAKSSDGSTVLPTAMSGVVAANPPATTGVPAIGGTLREGQTLTATPGPWTGTPAIA